ncbi:MAG: glycosyltransferase family 2 protein [Bacteroidota bacterium]
MDLNALILTYNEAPNIGRTLEKLQWVPRIVVLDSGSTDDTQIIVSQYDNTSWFERPFDDHTSQWNYGLFQCGISSSWVLAMDADYQISPELAVEIQRIVKQKSQITVDGYWARFKYAIDGQVIESGIYPPVQVLYRRDKATYKADGHTQRVHVNGESDWLDHPIIHDDRKSMTRWLSSQFKYAYLEAEKLKTSSTDINNADKLRKKSKLTPLIVFFYVLIIRSAWRDGVGGWKYAYQRLIAEILIQYHLFESSGTRKI